MKQLFNYQELIGKTIKEFPGYPENSEDLVIFFEDDTFAILSSYADMDSHQHSNFYVSDCLSNWQKKELGFITFEEYRKLEQASRKEDAIAQLAWLKREHPDLF
jgi:hypothetical protein